MIQGLHLLRFLAEKKSLLEQRQQQCALAKGEETAPSGQSGRFGDLIDGSPCRQVRRRFLERDSFEATARLVQVGVAVRVGVSAQVWVKPFASGRRPEEFGILLVAEKLEPLKGDCFVCQQQRVTVRVASFKASNHLQGPGCVSSLPPSPAPKELFLLLASKPRRVTTAGVCLPSQALSVFQFFQQVLIESLGCHAPFVDAANNLVDPDRVEEEPGESLCQSVCTRIFTRSADLRC